LLGRETPFIDYGKNCATFIGFLPFVRIGGLRHFQLYTVHERGLPDREPSRRSV
jgi:hypothetical protein